MEECVTDSPQEQRIDTMARGFNALLIDEQLDGTTPIETSQDISEALGRNDVIICQARATGSSGTNPTLTVKLQHSCDARNWVDAATLFSAVDISAPPYDAVAESSGTDLLGYVRLQIQLGGTTPSAYIRIGVTGRTN